MQTINLLFRREYAINDNIRIQIPTVGEVLEDEDGYYSLVSILTAMPIDFMVQLDDLGIDFTQINEYELFLLLFPSIQKQDTHLVFGDLDLSKFKFAQNESTGQTVLIDDENDIVIDQTNTTIKPLAFSAKKSEGLNISCGICDEVASWQGDQGIRFYEALKSSQGARKQPLLLSITTAGYVNGGIYDELIKRCTRLLMGDSRERRLAPFLYTIDEPEKWNDINELRKSMPNLGVSVSVDYMLEEIAVAEGSLTKKAEFLVKYCNIKQNSSIAWLSAVDIDRASGEPIEASDHTDCYCVGGIDLSRTTDLTACCVVIEKNGELYVRAKFYLPSEKLEEAKARDGLPYDIYIQRGLLQLSGDTFVDYHDCFEFFKECVVQYKCYPLVVGYDRYSAQYLVSDMEGFGFKMDDVYQGYNLTPVINEAEGLIRGGHIHIGDNDLLKIHMLNAALKHDVQTDRQKLVKLSATEHIDGMAALLDALTVRQKWWNELGAQLVN